MVAIFCFRVVQSVEVKSGWRKLTSLVACDIGEIKGLLHSSQIRERACKSNLNRGDQPEVVECYVVAVVVGDPITK